MRQKPTVLAREIVASSRLFRVEELQLRFSNGVERTYERLVGKGSGYGAVMIVALADAENALLVEEYCGGTDSYELSLPKGLIEPGEDVLEAQEAVQCLLQVAAGQQQVADHVEQARLHHLAEVQADVGVAAQGVGGLPEQRRLVMAETTLGRRRHQAAVLVGAPVDARRIMAKLGQGLVQQAPQGSGVGQRRGSGQ